ncbi:hypothetical protein TWF225_003546 [Orbilia oligospora]|uniref:Uncharacterized protein n=1 Tax=Orbilia oligospora TaxID=2813651 RepID=A0A7C8KJC8_ORBOL|nr:hypothetical protein TWF751_007475 [Orbilia oligospora]KAF3195126.1 hypothetical protein TWF225_003546 [Orbilia oligospora]KAF3259481.1 hypothetical protein TWF217_005177 [Orbilia oligospora]KAF3263963.1 hypothetical protein TWF128_001597 [Orbilia oligospora]KAF3287786.1 hypothetical protein TWF132_008306 [Orbilia oligospora]
MGDMPVDPEPGSFSTSSFNGSHFYPPTILIDMSRLGGPNPTTASLTREQLKIVRIIALCSSAITLIASAIVLHWFVRMKRNFRRQLIMILIICDTWKSLWSFVFPAVALANSTVATTSNFCQASGFFFAFGIETADFCILFIAIHAAISIFLPRTGPQGKSGLYQYRHTVYAILILLPITMAALAFTNKAPAYVAQTTWCYLPVRPFWYRLALAWIPRYIIMVSITGLYLAIYIYVKVTFRAYRARFRTSEFDTDATQPSQLDSSQTVTDRRGSVLSVFGATFKLPGVGKGTEKVREADVGIDPIVTEVRRLSETANDDIEEIEGVSRIIDLEKGQPSTSRRAEDDSTDEGRNGAGSDSTHDSTSRMVRRELDTSHPSAAATSESEEELRKRQYAIQRQLRFLFIYPCVYVLIWLIPLVNHSLQYFERFAERPSFPLVCISAIAIPIQGAIDCLLFSLREKPWRLVKKQTKQPFFSWMLGRHWEEPSNEDLNIEAMTEGQRHAYLRREREKQENEVARQERAEKKKNKLRMGRKNSMTWWDTFERANISGVAVSRQSSRQEGDAGRGSLAVPATPGAIFGADGKAPTRNSSFSSFRSLGRQRSRSVSDLWKNFSFSDLGRQGSISGNNRKQSTAVVETSGAIGAIEEEQNDSKTTSEDEGKSGSSSSEEEQPTSDILANSTAPLVDRIEPAEGLVMKGLPLYPPSARRR